MSQKKILLIDDALDIQMVVDSALGKKYSVKTAFTAAQGWALLMAVEFDLILLDIGLPDEDGFHLLSRIRMTEQHKNTPVIVLTGKGHTNDKVMGFQLGADDYMVKPFDPLELQARVDTRLRRQHEATDAEIRKGRFVVNLSKQRIYTLENEAKADLGLTTIEFKLLYHFLRHEDHLISREKIISEIWGSETNISDRSVDSHIYNLRQKLGPLSHLIRSVPRAGYRFSQNEKQAV